MKKHYLNYLLLITIGLLLIIITRGQTSYFGSTTDWLNQHVTFANYFRELFYETGNFFSSFSLNLGGGINLFTLSYYGLYSPWLTLSYLFPMIEMITYVQVINIISYLGTILLTYKFFVYKKYPNHIAIFVSLMMLCATPILFQYHRQFMFVNYLPFLLLGLFGVDRLLNNGKKGLFIVSTFLMIMTSFYYSISGICALFLYAVYLFIKSNKSKNKVFKELLLPFALCIGITVLLTAFLWLPTLVTLVDGRGGNISFLSFITNLLPNISFVNLLYHNYTLGLTSISLLSLVVGCFSKKKEVRVLTICIFIIVLFPIVSYIFNGGLYARGKILIPFLPLIFIIVAEFFVNLKLSLPWKKIVPIIGFLLLIAFGFEFRTKAYWYLCIIDFIFIFAAILFYLKTKKAHLFYACSLLVMITLCIFVNKYEEEYVSVRELNSYESRESISIINSTLESDKSFYRFNNIININQNMNNIYNSKYFQTSVYSSSLNSYYKDFYETFLQSYSEDNHLMLVNTLNPLFLSYMNVKYIIANDAPLGYELVNEGRSVSLYQNNNTFPFAYGTSKLLSSNDFKSLSKTDKMFQLLQSAVVSTDVLGDKYHLEESIIPFKIIENNILVSKDNGHFIFSVKEDESLQLQLDSVIDNKVLLLSFDVEVDSNCKEGGRIITINGIANQQSCESWTYANKNHTFYYALSSNTPWDKLSISISEGEYDISNIRTHLIDDSIMSEYKSKLSPFVVDNALTKDNKIVGNITQKEDGYFVTTLPYDKGFTIKVNGKETPYELVNTAFIGFPLKEGNYNIEFIYSAPLQKTGIYLSIMGIVIFIGITLFDHKRFKIKSE